MLSDGRCRANTLFEREIPFWNDQLNVSPFRETTSRQTVTLFRSAVEARRLTSPGDALGCHESAGFAGLRLSTLNRGRRSRYRRENRAPLAQIECL